MSVNKKGFSAFLFLANIVISVFIIDHAETFIRVAVQCLVQGAFPVASSRPASSVPLTFDSVILYPQDDNVYALPPQEYRFSVIDKLIRRLSDPRYEIIKAEMFSSNEPGKVRINAFKVKVH